jgi:hypothetical protein
MDRGGTVMDLVLIVDILQWAFAIWGGLGVFFVMVHASSIFPLRQRNALKNFALVLLMGPWVWIFGTVFLCFDVVAEVGRYVVDWANNGGEEQHEA